MEMIQSVKFKYKSNKEIKKLLLDFRDIINYCIEKCLELKTTSVKRLHQAVYKEFKEKYDYNTQYFPSAYRIATSILRSCRKKGKEPIAKKLFIKFNYLLTKFEGDKLRISIKPRNFITIPLIYGDYQQRFIQGWEGGKYKIGEIILNENEIIIPFKQEINLTDGNNHIAFDVNEKSLVGVNSEGETYEFDLSEIKRVHDCYFEKRRKIYSKIHSNTETRARILTRYKEREKNRSRDLLHKVSKKVVEQVKGKVIFENLTHIKKAINKKTKKINKYNGKLQNFSVRSKKLKRRLNAWNFRKLQFFVEYKIKLKGFNVEYLNPANTSKICYRCGGIIKSTEKYCSKCGLNRDVNACLNLLKMSGVSASHDSPLMSFEEGSLKNFAVLRQADNQKTIISINFGEVIAWQKKLRLKKR